MKKKNKGLDHTCPLGIDVLNKNHQENECNNITIFNLSLFTEIFIVNFIN